MREKFISGMINFLKRVKPIIVFEAINNIEKITSLLSEPFVQINISDILDIEYIHNYSGNSRNAVFVPIDLLWKTWLKSSDSHELKV